MNKYQKLVLIKFTGVIVFTAVVVIAMVNFKNWVGHSESMRAMEQLGNIVLKYRKVNGSVPPQSYVDEIRQNLEGNVRLGYLVYRAQWIGFDSTKDEILAYSKRRKRLMLFDEGYIVLRLDGRVEWVGKKQFEELLARQQSSMEIQMRQE